MARMPGKRDAAGADVRRRLLESAAGLFSAKGYAGATVREIVERAGVTKPAMYYYFRSKEGIYLDLMRAPLEGFVEAIESAAVGNGTARERIAKVGLLAYDYFLRHMPQARIMYSIYYGPPQSAPYIDFETVQLRFPEVILRLLKEGIGAGEFRAANPEDVMWILTGSVNVAMELELSRTGRSIGQSIGRRGILRMMEIVFDRIAAGGRRRMKRRRKS